jgi:N6-L-threonylcarbamoyladenine synthase
MVKEKQLKILAIETSCDETATAVLKFSRGKVEILSNIVSSQIDIHKKYGGVVPEVAARHHVENILPVTSESLARSGLRPVEIDLLAVTSGPGLVTSLTIGVETARALSLAWQKPLLAVNHMYAHIAGNFLQPISFPAVCLVVSGGHTEIIYLKDYWQFKKIGQTVDDAAGEAFDKVAKLLNLGYPGGPAVSATAEKFSIQNFQFTKKIELPRPMIKADNFDFSFSGLKTAVLYAVKKMPSKEKEKRTAEVCWEFQEAAIEVLTTKTIKAAKKYGVKTVLLAGGVAANKRLRESLKAAAEQVGYDFLVPEFKLCTDNAAMVGLAAGFLAKKQKVKLDNWKKIKADPNWELV